MKSINDLQMHKQGLTKSLRSYLDRFNKVVIHIKNLRDEATLDAIKMGTRMVKLKDNIITKKPKTLSKVIAIATKLIDLDEYIK